MPEYLYPGVYVEEVDTGNKPIEGVSTSTVGFLGIAERGPITPTYITSYTDFKRSFGGYVKDASGNPTAYLAYAVEGFFLNGGLRCYVARVTGLDTAHNGANPAIAASNAKLAPPPVISISAAGPGLYGNQIGYLIVPAGLNNGSLFKLVVYYWAPGLDAKGAVDTFNTALTKATPQSLAGILAITPLVPPPTQTEIFDNLSTDTNSSTYYVGTINGGSNLVTVAVTKAGLPDTTKPQIVLLSGGTDAPLAQADFEGVAADPTQPTNTPSGLEALMAQDDISLLCCPDEQNASAGGIAGTLVARCSTAKDRFAILQSPVAHPPAKVIPLAPDVISQYSAFYYPWLRIVDPTTNVLTLIPSGGHIAGIYARSDNEENVAKDPANEPILGIDSLEFPIDNQTQALLNPAGVNCLRYFKGQGNLVWGGRTTSSDPDWQYINVRRLFIFVEKSIQRGTQWVVFQNNDPTTWARVVRSVSDFLTGLWMQDMLMGATKEQAFFVRCDQTTMTQTDIESGRLIVLVGIAPVYPAEFVIFRIGQWSGGSSISEG